MDSPFDAFLQAAFSVVLVSSFFLILKKLNEYVCLEVIA